MITQEYLKSLLEYNPETGLCFWKWRNNVPKNWNSKYAGKQAGSKDKEGYLVIGIYGKQYRINILIWLYITGKWPSKDIDHKNNIKNDNRWDNLRLATFSQNGANRGKNITNVSGYKGVCWSKKAKKWQAQIMKNGKKYWLGYFDDPEEAARVYDKKALELFGEYAKVKFDQSK